MRFLAILGRKTRNFSEQQFEALLEPEAERVRDLYTQGILRSVAGRGDIKGAVVELECADADQAHRTISSLPLAAAEMLDVQVIPLLPYRGFAPRDR
jgi:muconolactone delta-isomerase